MKKYNILSAASGDSYFAATNIIEAFAEIFHDNSFEPECSPVLHLLIKGPISKSLYRKVWYYELNNHIHLIPWDDQLDLTAYLEITDVFACDWERLDSGFISLLMAHGIPIICPLIPKYQRLIDTLSGIFIPSCSGDERPKAIAYLLTTLIEDPIAQEYLSRGAKKKYEIIKAKRNRKKIV